MTTPLRAAVFEALNNAAEGGYDHYTDGMTDAQIAESLFAYDAGVEEIVDPGDEGYTEQTDLSPVRAEVAAWRAARAEGVPLPVPQWTVGELVSIRYVKSPGPHATYEGVLPGGRYAVTFLSQPGTVSVEPNNVLAPPSVSEVRETFGEFTVATVLAAGNLAPRGQSDRPIEELRAGDELRARMIPRADVNPRPYGTPAELPPMFHGWAIMEAFLAGVDWARAQGEKK